MLKMAGDELKVYLVIENKAELVKITPTSTAEDVCITLCKKLNIGTLARHLFALRVHGKQTFFMPGAKFTQKYREFDLRIRYKVTDIPKLKKLDIKAYDYFFNQARVDVLENKIPDLVFENYRKELVGLGITDMYRVMVEKDLPQETVEADYKKYIPKEVLRRHHFFVKKPIRDSLNKLKKSCYDVWYVKGEYLKQLDRMVPEYLAEEYKVIMEDRGSDIPIIIKVSQFAEEPGVNYMDTSKNDKWHNICSLEDIAFISIRNDTVELSRKNGIPLYLRFDREMEMLSFVSFVDGYYRLSVKWTFNLCRDVITPSIQKLYAMRCHGPVGGEYSYAKLEEKRNNTPGCFIIRESDSKYNIYYIDVCVKNSSKPKTFKLERLCGNEFIFNDDLTRYPSIAALIAAYNNEDNPIYLKECLPPSESDKSPLLLCARENVSADTVTEASSMVLNDPVFISNKNILVFKVTTSNNTLLTSSADSAITTGNSTNGVNHTRPPGWLTDINLCKLSHLGLDYVGKIGRSESGVRCQSWTSKTPMHRVDPTFSDSNFSDFSRSLAKYYCRNPNREKTGPWCYTMDPDNIWETCGIPLCSYSECRLSGPGMEYAGNIAKSAKGKKCLKWNKDRSKVKVNGEVVSINKYDRNFFPDETMREAKKFCRNPDGDVGGPWCFVETPEKKVVEKQYCDIPFCHDESCMVFTKEQILYTHYIYFPNNLINFTFGIKIWDPDSYLNASAKLVLSLYALPLTSNQLDKLAIGVEIYISNKRTAVTAGGHEVEYEETHGILKANKYVYFSLTWWHNIISLSLDGHTKPILMADLKNKDTLMNYKMNQFFYYSAQGNNVLWTFPFCDLEEHCDVHTTTHGNFQKYFPLHEAAQGQDLHLHVRAHHSAYVLLVASPPMKYPYFKIMIQRLDNITRVIYKEYEKASEQVIREIFADNILNYWDWEEFTITMFGDEFELYTIKRGLSHVFFSFKHEQLRLMRWYSVSSEDTVAHWTFYCFPPNHAAPPAAYLPECAITKNEIYYNGTQDVTRRGAPCLPWAGQKIMPTEINDLFKNLDDKFKANNYCRDPKSEQKGAFCYTLQTEQGETVIKKEFCGIRKCKSAECKMAGTGNDYIGTLTTTRSNRTCQHWLSPAQLKSLTEKEKNSTSLINITAPNAPLSVATLVKQLQRLNQYFDDTSCLDKWGCLRNFLDPRKSKKSIEQTHNEFENSDRYANESKHPPHEKEMVRLEALAHNTVNKMVEEIETQTSQYEYPYLYVVEEGYLNETLYADMNLLQIKNYCRNPTRDVAADKKQNENGVTLVYRCMWKHAKGKKIEVAMKTLKREHRDNFLKDMLEAAGQWSVVQSSCIVRLFGVTVSGYLSMILEYIKYGPLDEYLQQNKNKLKEVDLIEASSNLANALWHLDDIGLVHGKIRCKKLLVYNHDEREFKVKLTLPSLHSCYDKEEVHWIPVECYTNLDHARNSTSADVWAFGTTLWEIFSYGQKIKPMDLFQVQQVYTSGKRLPQPHKCPKDIYELMLSCWDRDPHHRKKPQSIVRDISQLMYQVYDSRRIHTYAQVNVPRRGISTASLASASTVAMDELCKAESMSEIDPDLMVTPNLNLLRRGWHSEENMINFDTSSEDFSSLLPNLTASTTITSSFPSMQSIFELDDYNVILQGRIGQGFYGEVYKGSLERIWESKIEPKPVAVKKLKKSSVSSTRQDFEREIVIMKALKHPNIVEILGVQNDPEVLLVMEYIPHGSLQCYVKIHKEQLTTKQLLRYSLDIAKGMDYLGQKNIVHRDLAARNILVVDENHVKISDFGLAQFMDSGHYYVLKTNRDLPVKWYAPESLEEGKFSTRSDVWSYGVTLWEMFSYGEEPKLAEEPKGEEPEQQHILRQLIAGIRYPCLSQFPRSTYVRVIHPCWAFNPHERPTFATLCTNVETELQHETD